MKKNIIFIVGVLFCCTVIAQKKETNAFTLEAIWSGVYDQKDIQPQLLNTKPAIAFIRADKKTNFEGILTLDMITGKIVDTIFTNQTKVEQGEVPITFTFFEDFTFSPDDSKILVRTEKQNIYHTSHKEFVFIWDDVKKTLKPVSTDGKISCAVFSPNGKYISYVRDGNLYFRNTENDKITSVTIDGIQGSIINGMADELYEDGFGLHTMYAWNEQSTKIAYIKLNQNYVRRIPVTNYENSETIIQQKVYAKAGETITEATLYIYDLEKKNSTKIFLGDNTNQYITNFKWHTDGNSVFVERLNRAQQKLDVLHSNATNGSTIKVILSEEAKPYVKVKPNNIKVVDQGKSFLWLSEQDGFNHIYSVRIDNGQKTQLTKGKWEVQNIEAYDEDNAILYYTANEASVMEKHLYKLKYNTTTLTKAQKLTSGKAWHDVLISKDANYFFDKFTTINNPYVYNIYKTNGVEITNKALIENKRFNETVANLNYKNAETFTFNNSKDNIINGWVINANKKNQKGPKPLLLYVYGSNNKQEVTHEWNNRMAMTFRYFSNLGYVVACIDPRGTPGKGTAFRSIDADKLAATAVEDIAEAKNYLIRNYGIDQNNTTLMGWSYGGYLTTMAATKFGGTFTKQIAIAPVTNWRDYNAPFTERLFQAPADNFEIYKNAEPTEHIDGYKGGLLLIHGTNDDNVHLKHSLQLAKQLTASDFYYDIQIFTDKGHSLSDGQIDKTRMNLFRKIEKFLQF